jgi:hypothetical protein
MLDGITKSDWKKLADAFDFIFLTENLQFLFKRPISDCERKIVMSFSMGGLFNTSNYIGVSKLESRYEIMLLHNFRCNIMSHSDSPSTTLQHLGRREIRCCKKMKDNRKQQTVRTEYKINLQNVRI